MFTNKEELKQTIIEFLKKHYGGIMATIAVYFENLVKGVLGDRPGTEKS